MNLPAPYYHDAKAGITIYHGDCREILPELEPVDLVLTDPPYGVGLDYGGYKDTPANLKGLVGAVFHPLIEDETTMLVTPGQAHMGFYPAPRHVLAWVCPSGTGVNCWGFTCWHPILAYGPDPYLANGMGSRPDIFIHEEAASTKAHPCAKPIGLWKKILERGSIRQGDTILDPFMGSGTTLRAAKDLGRKAIGIEIEEKYCEIAAKRLAQEVFDW